LRLIVPGWYGMTHVKWLGRIEAVTKPFEGYQQKVAYLYKQFSDDPGEPVTRMRPRALMIPPGFPDFLSRQRTVERGRMEIVGRAWSGIGSIVKVELGVDGEWRPAKLEEPAGRFAWLRWTAEWDAAPGEHVLSCRAADSAGNTQPSEQPWNYQGMGNNLIQTVKVTVR
jgi:sulfane dehydrogenase subunit SoxC